MNNVNIDYIATIMVIGIMLTVFMVLVEHDTDVKIDCIKSISKDHYTVDEINRLCGVVK